MDASMEGTPQSLHAEGERDRVSQDDIVRHDPSGILFEQLSNMHLSNPPPRAVLESVGDKSIFSERARIVEVLTFTEKNFWRKDTLRRLAFTLGLFDRVLVAVWGFGKEEARTRHINTAALACMLIQSKWRDVYPDTCGEIVRAANDIVDKKDVYVMEGFVLGALNWEVLMATVPDFIQCALLEINPKMQRDSVFEECRILYLEVIRVPLEKWGGTIWSQWDTILVAFAILSAALAVTVPNSTNNQFNQQNIMNVTAFMNRHCSIEAVEVMKHKILAPLRQWRS